MALKIEIIEPGEDSVIVDLEERVDENRRVTIGRPRGRGYPHHIPLEKAPGLVSAIQLTLEIRGEDDDQQLWVCDGGAKGDTWKPSTNKTRLNADFLPPKRWHLLRVGDALRIGRPQNIELSGFVIRYATSETVSGTMSGAETTSFGAIEVWHAESIISDKGVMLLRKLASSDQLVIEKLDYAAEEALGGQTGDLIALQGRLLLETLINERDDLDIQTRLSRQQQSPVHGFYTGMSSKLKLVLRRIDVDGQEWFLGYTSDAEEQQKKDQPELSLKQEIGRSIVQVSSRYPILFFIGLSLAFGLALLIYVLTQ